VELGNNVLRVTCLLGLSGALVACFSSLCSCFGVVALFSIRIDFAYPISLGIAWFSFLSIATVFSEFICYPWDCLLLEVGFLALFLYPLSPGPSADYRSLRPSWPITFALRLLLVRLMLGMGKKKFGWGWWQNMLYIKWFSAWQPVPSFLAYFAFAFVPDVIWKLALVAMFIIEVFAPIFIIIIPMILPHVSPSTTAPLVFLSVYSARVNALLQIGIAGVGNYGLFNLLTFILCLPFCFQDALSPALSSADGLVSKSTGSAHIHEAVVFPAPFTHVLVLLLVGSLGVISFPYCSFTTLMFPFQPTRFPVLSVDCSHFTTW
jgi:hypothetical protein